MHVCPHTHTSAHAHADTQLQITVVISLAMNETNIITKGSLQLPSLRAKGAWKTKYNDGLSKITFPEFHVSKLQLPIEFIDLSNVSV